MFAGCAEKDFQAPDVEGNSDLRINLTGSIDQLCATRANDDGFVDGDVIGVYIVDYRGNNVSVCRFMRLMSSAAKNLFPDISGRATTALRLSKF